MSGSFVNWSTSANTISKEALYLEFVWVDRTRTEDAVLLIFPTWWKTTWEVLNLAYIKVQMRPS